MRLTRSPLAVTVAMLVSVVSPAAAQVAVEADVKAAYLYNFARFVEWPSDVLPAGAPLVLCIAGDAAVAGTLQELVKTRTINGHALAVRRFGTDVVAGPCHPLYVAGVDAARALRLLDTVRRDAVLSVSDASHFADRGGVAQLVLDDGRIGVAVNADAAQRNRLRVSAKLLSLAHLVQAERR